MLALGIPLAIAIPSFCFFKRKMDGPAASIVVVDRRTMRLAQQRISEAMEAGELARASAGQMALIKWLRHESMVGPRRFRDEYTQLLADVREQHSVLIGALLTSGRG